MVVATMVMAKIITVIDPNSGMTLVPIISIVASSFSKLMKIFLAWEFWGSSVYGTCTPSISMMNISSTPFSSVESMYCRGNSTTSLPLSVGSIPIIMPKISGSTARWPSLNAPATRNAPRWWKNRVNPAAYDQMKPAADPGQAGVRAEPTMRDPP